MKPNRKWTHAELKVYVTKHGLDRAAVPLSGTKKNMIANLKKAPHGGEGYHWDHAGTGRPAPVEKRPKKERPKKERPKMKKEDEEPKTDPYVPGGVKSRAKTASLPWGGLGGSEGVRVAQRNKDKQTIATHFSQQKVRARGEDEAHAVGAAAKANRGIGQVEAAAEAKKRRKKKRMAKLMKAKGVKF